MNPIEKNEMNEMNEMNEKWRHWNEFLEQQWRQWSHSRCYCYRPVPVQDPSRYPYRCAICGGYVPTRDDNERSYLSYLDQRLEQLERENRMLRIAVLVLLLLAFVSALIYDYTSTLGGRIP